VTETPKHLLELYLRHLAHRVKSAGKNLRTYSDEEHDLLIIPDEVSAFCSSGPEACLQVVCDALAATSSPQIIAAIGDGLLEDLLNGKATLLRREVAHQLRTSKKFRQAFANGEYSSVPPEIVVEWVAIFQQLGTSKEAERRSLWHEQPN